MLGFMKKENNKTLNDVLNILKRDEISITINKAKKNGDYKRSKFGGKPAVSKDFIWPRYEGENYYGETDNRPLSFLCQINLEDIEKYDKENLLPHNGLLLFFYEQETMRWGFDPKDEGCSRVFYFDNTNYLEEKDFPSDLKEEYIVNEYDLSFSSGISYPSYEEVGCYMKVDCDWDSYDEAVEKAGFEGICERHKLLGYADLIQGEMLSECERVSRNLYCGNAKSYQNLSKEEKADIDKASKEWILLFQMASIQDEEYELMFGDLGNLYFYIRKSDLKDKKFEKVWLVLQCG
ncbi:MAG: DUF1963 domain-containing protein [Clostridia bacterium]|nr:DUF1963 domain-containing protein [Clostridia bacterium]